jgi:nucleotide-binding universal stress UspA family protein
MSAEGNAKGRHDEPSAVHISMKGGETNDGNAIAEEKSSGYGLLWVGVKNPVSRTGKFSRKVNAAAADFDDALALVSARGEHLADPEQSPLNIYLPVDGTRTSRFAAEVAFAIARACKAEVTAVYVSGRSRTRRKATRDTASRAQEKAIMAEIDALGRRYSAKLKTVRLKGIAKDVLPEDLQQREANLVIMGVNKRPGETLFFGDTVESLIRGAERSFVLLTAFEKK